MQGVDVCEPDQHAGVDQGVGGGQREGGVAVGAQGRGADPVVEEVDPHAPLECGGQRGLVLLERGHRALRDRGLRCRGTPGFWSYWVSPDVVRSTRDRILVKL